MKTQLILTALLCTACIPKASGEVTTIVTQGEEFELAATYDTADLIQGVIPEELPGDMGWHPVNTDPADQLVAFTDGEGVRSTGLTGLLNDFPSGNPEGKPVKLIEYALPVPADISEIRVFSGNNNRDGRVFQTYTVRFSSDWGETYTDPIYVQSHLSGTVNSVNDPSSGFWRAVLSQLTNTTGLLASRVTHVEFDFYPVDNTLGEMRDPFDGENPFTGVDDGLSAAFVSPLVWEIDVLGEDSAPEISVEPVGANLQLSWFARAPNAQVQTATQLNPANWVDLDPQPPIVINGYTFSTTVPESGARQYFRLRVEP